MTAQQFCDLFGCHIAFCKDGTALLFGKEAGVPKYMKDFDWYVPTNGHDTTMLPSLIDDYDVFSKRHKHIVISPGAGIDSSSYIEEVKKKGEKRIVPCDDFKKDDMFEGNINVIEVFTMPDCSGEGEKYIVTCRDEKNGHDFVWNTKSKNIPNEGDMKYLKAKIVGNTYSMEFDIPSFEVTNCKFLLPKKEGK